MTPGNSVPLPVQSSVYVPQFLLTYSLTSWNTPFVFDRPHSRRSASFCHSYRNWQSSERHHKLSRFWNWPYAWPMCAFGRSSNNCRFTSCDKGPAPHIIIRIWSWTLFSLIKAGYWVTPCQNTSYGEWARVNLAQEDDHWRNQAARYCEQCPDARNKREHKRWLILWRAILLSIPAKLNFGTTTSDS